MRHLIKFYIFLKSKFYGAFCEHEYKKNIDKINYQIYECEKCYRTMVIYN